MLMHQDLATSVPPERGPPFAGNPGVSACYTLRDALRSGQMSAVGRTNVRVTQVARSSRSYSVAKSKIFSGSARLGPVPVGHQTHLGVVR